MKLILGSLTAVSLIIVFGMYDVYAATHVITLQEGHEYSTCTLSNGCMTPNNITIQLGDTIKFVNPTQISAHPYIIDTSDSTYDYIDQISINQNSSAEITINKLE